MTFTRKIPGKAVATIALALALAAASLAVPPAAAGAGDHKLARFVCQYYEALDTGFNDYVVIFDQLSIATDPKANFGFETADGTIMIDPHHPRFFTGETDYRMRIYKASLVPSGVRFPSEAKANAELRADGEAKLRIVEGLVQRQADRLHGLVMDYTGKGSRLHSKFVFGSDGYTDFKRFALWNLKEPSALIGLKGILANYRDRQPHFLPEGSYRCLEPMLLPGKG